MSPFVLVDYQVIFLRVSLLLFCTNVVMRPCSKTVGTKRALCWGYQRRAVWETEASSELVWRLGGKKNQEIARGLTSENTLLVLFTVCHQKCICSKDTAVFEQVSKDYVTTSLKISYANMLFSQKSPYCQIDIRYNRWDFPFTALTVLT